MDLDRVTWMLFRGARRVFLGLLASRDRAVGVLAAVVGLCGLWAFALAGSAAAANTSVAFTTQGCTTWLVPAGVSSVQLQATGAAGSAGFSGSASPGAGGLGDGVSGTLSGLTGGTQVLDVCVDQDGGPGGLGQVANGGDGGGASGVSLGSDFSSPVLVAGGGGGGGADQAANGAGGGGAGMPVGSNGNDAHSVNNLFDFFGGTGGDNTTMMGGTGGINDGPGPSASHICVGVNGSASGPAGPGDGGSGGDVAANCAAGGGGGGGGYFGGGGGASGSAGGGGGGGSDFCATSVTCTVSSGAGTQTVPGTGTGFAQVTITYSTSEVPASKAACMNGGWQNLTDSNGTPFKNQGDCVSYVATGGKNPANG